MTTSVVFIHGLWIHSSSWDPWQRLFDEQGYRTAAPGWPGDGETVVDTRAHPERLHGVGVDAVTDFYAQVIDDLGEAPVVIGHSFGGLVAAKLWDRGLAAAAVGLSPAPIKGVRAVPFSLLRSGFPVLRSPGNRTKAVALTESQFAYSFGNALPPEESAGLYRDLAIPGPGRPLFEAATANFHRTSPTSVDTSRAGRGPMLLVAAGKDHTVPAVVVRGAHRLYRRGGAGVELRTYEDRGHSAPFDHGWRELADDTLAWLDDVGLRP